jgi:hypothetical protein
MHLRTNSFVTAAALIALVLVAVSGAMAQRKTTTTEQLAQRAEVVAVGRVKNLSPEWNESRTAIRTRVIFAVDEVVKGQAPGSTLTIYVPGGEVNGVGEVYSHMPTFKKEEQAVVFVEKDKDNHFRVSGGQDGKLAVVQDPTTGKPVVAGVKPLAEFTAQVKDIVKGLQSQQAR